MKKALLFFNAMLCAFYSFGQLKADAGADKVWCFNSPNASTHGPQLGGTPAAQNGTPPYTYEWFELKTGYPASTLLDSFTNPNPTLVYFPGSDTELFVLRVTDANSAIAYDSVTVKVSWWVCPMAVCSLAKKAPDTISMKWQYPCMSQVRPFLPFTFKYWTPSLYLSDSMDENTQCWAPVPMEYTVVSVDGFGCISKSTCDIWFPTTKVGSEALPSDKALITPNPLASESILKCGRNCVGGILTITAADGRLIRRLKVTGENTPLPWGDQLSSGIYFYCLTAPSGKVQTGKLVKQ